MGRGRHASGRVGMALGTPSDWPTRWHQRPVTLADFQPPAANCCQGTSNPLISGNPPNDMYHSVSTYGDIQLQLLVSYQMLLVQLLLGFCHTHRMPCRTPDSNAHPHKCLDTLLTVLDEVIIPLQRTGLEQAHDSRSACITRQSSEEPRRM